MSVRARARVCVCPVVHWRSSAQHAIIYGQSTADTSVNFVIVVSCAPNFPLILFLRALGELSLILFTPKQLGLKTEN